MLDYLQALHELCTNWHSGQWSKGYRILCHTQRYLRRWYPVEYRHWDCITLSTRGHEMYRRLQDKYCDEL